MSTTVALDNHAKRIVQCLKNSVELKSASDDFRLRAGRELIAARRRVEAGETNLSWSDWCAQYIERSDRDIRRLMALAGAADPARAREDEKARNRAARPAGSRKTSPFQAHDEGVGAFRRGVAEKDCPYPDGKRHAAWRKGWSDMKRWTDASPPVPPAAFVNRVTHPLAELHQAIEKFWPRLSLADQESLINWLMEHMAEAPTMAVAKG